MNTLIVGDIHGCRDELEELISHAGIGAQDEIIALGAHFLKEHLPVTSQLHEHLRIVVARLLALTLLEHQQATPEHRQALGMGALSILCRGLDHLFLRIDRVRSALHVVEAVDGVA